MVQDHRGEYASLWPAIESIAPKIGCVPQTLHEWVCKQEVDTGMRDGITSEERDRRLKFLETSLISIATPTGRANLQGIADCPVRVSPPCCLPTHARVALCSRQADDILMPQIQQVWQANLQVYGADKVWHQLNREGVEVARCTVERLMSRLGLQGVRRGKVVRTTVPDKALHCPLDRVNRQFKADCPKQLWVSDFTYVSTWPGCQYVAFAINVYARRIVGWRVSSSMRTDFVLDALEQALYERQPDHNELIHHSDRRSQYVSILYTARLAQAGIVPSVGSRGESDNNALAETINGSAGLSTVRLADFG